MGRRGIFAGLYRWMARASRHRHAEGYLAALSFAESSFFPLPPDLMLAPMVLLRRSRAWRLALVTTLSSVAGGVAGYFIGKFFFFELGAPLVKFYGAGEVFARTQEWFGEYGVLIVLVAGFTPVPYKLFTLTSGFLSLSLPLFIAASLAGRGARFYLVSALVVWGGEGLAAMVEKHIEKIGWTVVALLALFLWWTA
ncbi:MAG: DedA family protein [Gammaproteobacteria bacterium]|nr:DedA family protein [Gammaproteobacteria bacterium]MDD9851914.1 DedA family protein [Gammaproteobacteria bacterium]MDD9870644.1 DedA family protein [Gammaproteobacteria bacterium]